MVSKRNSLITSNLVFSSVCKSPCEFFKYIFKIRSEYLFSLKEIPVGSVTRYPGMRYMCSCWKEKKPPSTLEIVKHILAADVSGAGFKPQQIKQLIVK